MPQLSKKCIPCSRWYYKNVMKKILDFFDYIAYRMHKFVIAHPRMIVPDAAPFIFSLVFFYASNIDNCSYLPCF
jgi:hypothetical protein